MRPGAREVEDSDRGEGDRKAAIRFIVCLGVVSMFADMTYEGAHSVIGPLLSDLGSSATQALKSPAASA